VQVATFAVGSLFGPSHQLAPAPDPRAARSGGAVAVTRTTRYAAPLAIAALITFGLFVVMSSLVASRSETAVIRPAIPVYLIPVPEPSVPIPPPKPVLPKIRETTPQPPLDGIPVGDPVTRS